MTQTVKNSPAVQENQVLSRDQEDALEKRMATHSSLLAWGIHGAKTLAEMKSAFVGLISRHS